MAKRRQTGRLLRSALIPIWLIVVSLGLKAAWGVILIILSMLVVYCLLLGLYAYAEATIYQEGYRGEQIKMQANGAKEGLGRIGKPAGGDTPAG